MVKSGKAAKVAAASASLGISSWLSNASPSTLGRAKPIEAAARTSTVKDDSDDSDEDDFDEHEDERLLELRRLTDLEEGGEDGFGNDWIARYASDDEDDDEEDDDDEDDDEDDDDEPPPPPQPKKKVAPAPVIAPPKTSTASAAAPPRPVSQQHKGLFAGAAVPVSSIPAARVAVLDDKKKPAVPKAAETTLITESKSSAAAAATTISPPPVALSSKKRALPAAFVPTNVQACVFLGNLPLDCSEVALRSTLAAHGRLAVVHREVNNSGAPSGFGYAEFTTPAAALAAASAGNLKIGSRDVKVSAYTPAMNYRKPDGSRNKEKKNKVREDEKGGAPSNTHPGERRAGKKPRPAREN